MKSIVAFAIEYGVVTNQAIQMIMLGREFPRTHTVFICIDK